MINFTTINTAIKDFLTTYGNAFAMQAENNRPRPSLPYFTFRTASLVSIGNDSVLTPDEDGVAEIIGDREFTIGIQYFGDNAIGVLENLYASLTKEKVKSDFETAGFVFVMLMGNINNISELVDSKYEERSSMDLLCRVASVVDDADVGYINGEKIDYTYKLGDITILEGNMESGEMPI